MRRAALVAVSILVTAFASIPVFAQSPDEAPSSSSIEGTNEGAAPAKEGTPIVPIAQTPTIRLWTYFKAGGPLMWPLLFLAAFAMALIIDRALYFKKAGLPSRAQVAAFDALVTKGDVDALEAACDKTPNALTRVFKYGLAVRGDGHDVVEKTLSVSAGVEVNAMERWLTALLAIGNVAPMTGFLGTVTGMVGAFDAIAAADQISARIVATGIREALITTVAGLIIAIPIILVHNYFQNRIERYVAEAERLGGVFVEQVRKADMTPASVSEEAAAPTVKKTTARKKSVAAKKTSK